MVKMATELIVEDYSDKCLMVRPPSNKGRDDYDSIVKEIGGRWIEKLAGS